MGSNNSPLESLAAFAIVFVLGVLSTASLAAYIHENEEQGTSCCSTDLKRNMTACPVHARNANPNGLILTTTPNAHAALSAQSLALWPVLLAVSVPLKLALWLDSLPVLRVRLSAALLAPSSPASCTSSRNWNI